MIDRQIEKALQLVLMEIDREHSVRARHRDHVGHELRADGDPRLIFAVLPGIAEVRNDRRDPRRAGPLGGVHEEQQLDHVFRRRIRGLDDVDVPAPNVLIDLDEQLAVGEPAERDLAERLAQVGCHFFGQGPIPRPSEQQHLAAREREVRHDYSPQT